MGHWKEVSTLYGLREQWVPDDAQDWPGDVPGQTPPPPPCARCGGKLQRFVTITGGMTDERWRVTVRQWEILGKPDPVPVRPEPVSYLHYDFAHYRDCLPTPSVDEVTLTRPKRV
jgi:hypothetical protein